MKLVTLFLTALILSQFSYAEPVAVKINLPSGVTLREVKNTTVVPLDGADEQNCIAEVVLPKFQFANTDEVSTAMKRLSRKWFRMGLRSVNEFLKGTSSGETCQGDFFSAQQVNLGYTFTAQYGSVVSMVVDSYWYSGGAHGYGGIDKVLLNFSTGKEVPGTLDTFFKTDKLATLVVALESKLFQNEDFDPGFGWNEVKAEMNEMTDVSNYYLTQRGITFFWNAYAIGPYAAGTIEVNLSWQEIKDLDLKNNSDYSAALP